MKASIFCGTSLDGYIARADGNLDFLDAVDPPELDGQPTDGGFGDFLAAVDALVMGRNTFDKVMELVKQPDIDWPYGDLPVLVLTSRPLSVPDDLGDLVEATDLAPAELLAVLSSRFVDHVYVDGGLTAQSFLREGLIDEIIVTTVPVLIGDGISLFGQLAADVAVELLDTTVFSNGFVQSHYRVLAD